MSAATNGVKNPVKKPVRRIPLSPKGGAQLIPGNAGNSGGKPGRSGRKTDEYRDLCAAMLESPAARKSVKAIIKDHKHPHFATIYKHLAEYGFGKPVQPISGEDGGAVTVRVVYEDAGPTFDRDG